MRALGLIIALLANLFFLGTASAVESVYTFCAQSDGHSVYRCQTYPAPTGGGAGFGGGVTPEEKLNTGRLAIMSEFESGAAKFVSEKDYKKFYLGASIMTGSGGELDAYFTSRTAADGIMKEAGGSLTKLVELLKLPDPDYFTEGGGAVRIDIPFRFEARPRLPSGFEKGANKYFKFGGVIVSGKGPELILHGASTKGMTGTKLVHFKRNLTSGLDSRAIVSMK